MYESKTYRNQPKTNQNKPKPTKMCPVRAVSQFLRCFSIFLWVEICPNRSEWRPRSRRTTAAAAGEERWTSTLEIGRRGFAATAAFSQAAGCPLQGNAPCQIDLDIDSMLKEKMRAQQAEHIPMLSSPGGKGRSLAQEKRTFHSVLPL